MNKFVNAISNEASLNGSAKLTENGAVARSTTGDCLLDFMQFLVRCALVVKLIF